MLPSLSKSGTEEQAGFAEDATFPGTPDRTAAEVIDAEGAALALGASGVDSVSNGVASDDEPGGRTEGEDPTEVASVGVDEGMVLAVAAEPGPNLFVTPTTASTPARGATAAMIIKAAVRRGDRGALLWPHEGIVGAVRRGGGSASLDGAAGGGGALAESPALPVVRTMLSNE